MQALREGELRREASRWSAIWPSYETERNTHLPENHEDVERVPRRLQVLYQSEELHLFGLSVHLEEGRHHVEGEKQQQQRVRAADLLHREVARAQHVEEE